MLSFIFASAWLGAVIATPLTHESFLEARQSRQVDVSADVSNAQFRTFQNPSVLRAYLRSRGFNYDLNYTQISAGVTSINQYFANKAAQTSTNPSPASPFAPQDSNEVMTNSLSTSLKDGPSYTNVSLSANAALVEALSFSDGNASTAGGAIQRTQTISSTSSAGRSNSTATVTGSTSLVQILTSATVDGASDQESVNGGAEDALTAGSCAARANGASARASLLTTMSYPVNATGSATAGSVSRAFCEAGVSAKRSGRPGGTGTSSSGMQAALTDGGVFAAVTCNGRRTANTNPNIVFTLRLQGTYSPASGFSGMFTAARNASVAVSCS